jgi:hypothetical protein
MMLTYALGKITKFLKRSFRSRAYPSQYVVVKSVQSFQSAPIIYAFDLTECQNLEVLELRMLCCVNMFFRSE